VKAVDRGDVGVIQRREQLGLTVEAHEALGVLGDRGRENLDGDLAVERGVFGFPDDAHAALADLLDEAVVEQSLVGLEGHGLSVGVGALYRGPREN